VARGRDGAEISRETMSRAPVETNCRAVVVLGAGRSGTSAITRGIQAVGVELGDRLRPPGGKNPTGFFEDQDLLGINKRLKRALAIRGDSVRLIEDEEWRAAAVLALQDEAVQTIRSRFGAVSLWGYKYGRTLRLLPFWSDVFATLALDVRYVVALRNPLSVARSRAALDPRRGTQEKSDLEWLVNVVPYFARVRERPFAVVDYDRLMGAPLAQLRRMVVRLGLPLTPAVEESIGAYAAEFLKPGMRHSRFAIEDLERDARANRLTVDAYRWLDRLAGDEIDPAAPDLWRDWRRIEAALLAMTPVLRHVDRVEDDLRRAQRNPLGPLQAAPQVWRKLRSR
jgi:hypothetical protein